MEKTVLAGNGIEKQETGDRSMETGDRRLPAGVTEAKTGRDAKSRKHGMGIAIRRLLMMMVAMMMALATFTGCDEDENNSDPDENGNGGGGGVSGKRIKSELVVITGGALDSRGDYTYSSDGTLERIDHFLIETSQLNSYEIFTYNSDGTRAKQEQYMPSLPKYSLERTYTYDAGKQLSKSQMKVVQSAEVFTNSTFNYTYQNGRKIRETSTHSAIAGPLVASTEQQIDYNYDSKGRRTSYTKKVNGIETNRAEYTYNSDGTLQKLTLRSSDTNQIFTTFTFTWENEKSNYDFFKYN